MAGSEAIGRIHGRADDSGQAAGPPSKRILAPWCETTRRTTRRKRCATSDGQPGCRNADGRGRATDRVGMRRKADCVTGTMSRLRLGEPCDRLSPAALAPGRPALVVQPRMAIVPPDLPSVSVCSGRYHAGDEGYDRQVRRARVTEGLSLVRFPNGGSWSFFVCPCGRRARILRLYEGGLACFRCLAARGLRARVELVSHFTKRAALTAPKRIERLNSDTPGRLHPRPGRMLDRRANLELRSSAASLSSVGLRLRSSRRISASHEREQLCR